MKQRDQLFNNKPIHTSIVNEVFGKDLLLLTSVNELFELELALIESRSLSRQELLLGIDSIGIDVSPFCRLLARVV